MGMPPFFGGPPERRLKRVFIGRSGRAADNAAVSTRPEAPLHRRASRRHLLPQALLALATALLLPPAGASDERDHERARAAVQRGEVLPLPKLLERLQRTHPGQVLELELEREDGRWVYELKLLQPGGQLLKLEVDAATGQVLQTRRRKSDRRSTDAEPAR